MTAPPSLKARALRLLAQREHSRAELQRKLQPHEVQPGELDQALDALEARGFIDAQRVADSVVQRRAGKLGAARIQGELQARGLDPELVQSTVAAVRETEWARAREVWQKKFGHAPADAAERARQMRFLAARGFAPDILRRVIDAGDDGN